MPKEESFPIPTKYIDVTRTTQKSSGVMIEKHIEDYWNVMGTHGPGRDLQENNFLLVLTTYGQKCGRVCPMQPKRKHNKEERIEEAKAR